jgi:hypothetical protein
MQQQVSAPKEGAQPQVSQPVYPRTESAPMETYQVEEACLLVSAYLDTPSPPARQVPKSQPSLVAKDW